MVFTRCNFILGVFYKYFYYFGMSFGKLCWKLKLTSLPKKTITQFVFGHILLERIGVRSTFSYHL